MARSKKLASCLMFLDLLFCLTGAALGVLCVFLVVMTSDFNSAITTELWNSLIGLGSLGAFAVLTGSIGCCAVVWRQKNISIIFIAFVLATTVGVVATGVFFAIEGAEVSRSLESHINTTSVEESQALSNQLDCDVSVTTGSDSCLEVLGQYLDLYYYVVLGVTSLLLVLLAIELLVSLIYRQSLSSTHHSSPTVVPSSSSSEMYGNWWAESGTGGQHYFRGPRQPNPQHY